MVAPTGPEDSTRSTSPARAARNLRCHPSPFPLRSGSLAAALLAVGCGSSGSSTGTSGTPAAASTAGAAGTAGADQHRRRVGQRDRRLRFLRVERRPPPSAVPARASLLAAGRTSAGAHRRPVEASAAAPAKPPPAPAADAGALDAGAAVTGVSDAGPPSPGQQVAQQVDAIFAGRKTFSAHFEQQHTQKFNEKVEDSSGTVLMERPGKISFRYDPPNQNRIVCDGVTMKVYMAADKTMYEKPMGSTPYPGVLSFMMGGGIAGSFTFTLKNVATYPAGTVLEGKPLTPEPSYETVIFFIQKALLAKGDPGAMERVLLLDAQGNKNRFTFSRVTQPATIAPAEFTFTPPPGTTLQR